MSRRRFFNAVNMRRTTQVVLLLVFIGLIAMVRPVPGAEPSEFLKAWFFVDPLILIATWAAAHAVPAAAFLAIVTIVVTMALGRVFCGWICPLGTVHDMAGRVFDGRKRGKRPPEHFSPRQRVKYYLLIGFLAMAVFGGHWVTIFDPLVLFYRTTVTAIMPSVQWAVEDGATTVYQADPGVGGARLTKVTEPVYGFFRDHVFTKPGQSFLNSGGIAVVFIVIVALNAYRRRFWCRYLCPLGALLGVCAQRPLLRRKTEASACNQCDLCGNGCHGAASASGGEGWKPMECMVCLNCTDSCHRGALSFAWTLPWRKEPRGEGVDLSRRVMMGSAVGGVAALALMRATPQSRGERCHPTLIRPPGARGERDFLARCTSCGACMKICPTGGLQPTLGEAGLEGIWTPRLVPRLGYCDYTCNLCGQACPTGAIEPLTLEVKQQTKLGLAAFDTTRCLPYAYGRDCMVCEEHCPIPNKAIYFLEVDVRTRDGVVTRIRQPHVDPDLCIGCGVCEHVCPYKDRPAVRVFSANESRNAGNQPILPGGDGLYS